MLRSISNKILLLCAILACFETSSAADWDVTFGGGACFGVAESLNLKNPASFAGGCAHSRLVLKNSNRFDWFGQAEFLADSNQIFRRGIGLGGQYHLLGGPFFYEQENYMGTLRVQNDYGLDIPIALSLDTFDVSNPKNPQASLRGSTASLKVGLSSWKKFSSFGTFGFEVMAAVIGLALSEEQTKYNGIDSYIFYRVIL